MENQKPLQKERLFCCLKSAAVLALLVLGLLGGLAGLILLAVLVLGILGLVLIAVIHTTFLQNRCGPWPGDSVCSFSGFILGFENQTHHQPRDDGRRDAAGRGLQSPAENPKEAVLRDGFFHALCQGISETC